MRSSTSCAEARPRGRGILLAAVACVSCAASASDSLPLEVIPAWDGWSRPGRITELELRLHSLERRSVTVRVNAGLETVRTEIALEPGQPSSTFIPLRAAESVTVDTGGEGDTRDVRLALSESPLLAWVVPAGDAEPFAGFHGVSFDPGRLPHTSSAYSSIDALVIDRRLLPSLAQDQFAAWLSYVAGCGRTVLVGASPADEGLFRTAVGCGGHSFAAVASAGDVGAELDRMLAAAVERPPDAVSLSQVDGPDLRAWYLVVTVLAVCAAVVVLAGIFTSSLAAAIVVPALLAAGVFGFMQSRSPEGRLVVWAESGAQEHLAQYRGLQRGIALGRGRFDMPVLAALARPQACRADDTILWSWDAPARRLSSARFEGRLFSSASLCYAGEFPVARSADVRALADGRIALSNTGASTSPAGALAWNRQLFPVGELRPGGEIVVAPEGGKRAQGGAQGMALNRTPLDAQAILWPLDLGRVTDAPSQSQAWLLLRVGPPGLG